MKQWLRGSSVLVGWCAALACASGACGDSRRATNATLGSGGDVDANAPETGRPPTPVGAADAGTDARDAEVVAPGEVRVREQTRPACLQHDAQNLYWVVSEAGKGAVMKVPLAGGAPIALAQDLVQPDSLRIDGSSAYWINYGSKAGIYRVPLAGGSPVELVSVAYPVPIRQLAIDADNVYYTDGVAGAVYRVAKSGGTPVPFAQGLSGPADIVIDGSDAYVVAGGDSGSIVRFPLSGGPGTTLASDQPNPNGIVVKDGDVFWINGGTFDVASQRTLGAAVMRVPKAGGAPSAVVDAEWVKSLVVEGASVFFAQGDKVMRVPAAGGTASAFAPLQAAPRSLSVDGTHVYWTNWGTGTKGVAEGEIRRLPK